MASAKMSGDLQTLQMLSAMGAEARDVPAEKSKSKSKRKGKVAAPVGGATIERIDAQGESHPVDEEERANLGRMLQSALGGLFGQDGLGAASGMPSGVVVMDGEGNVVSGDSLPPEVMAAIAALANGEMPEGAVLVSGGAGESDSEEEDGEDGDEAILDSSRHILH